MSDRGYMLRSARGDWRTPPEVVALVREALGGEIALDPCAPATDHIARAVFTEAEDGLAWPWFGPAYVNPPFGALAKWAEKCATEARRGVEVVLLLPARTDTKYWHRHVSTSQAVCLWKGRIRFIGARNQAPFPTAFAYWGPRPWRFHEVFSSHGMVVVPSAASDGRGT